MLVLTRKTHESVVIGNSIRVVVLETSSGAVKLGFDAPADMSIYREELHGQVAVANRAALSKGDFADAGGSPEDS